MQTMLREPVHEQSSRRAHQNWGEQVHELPGERRTLFGPRHQAGTKRMGADWEKLVPRNHICTQVGEQGTDVEDHMLYHDGESEDISDIRIQGRESQDRGRGKRSQSENTRKEQNKCAMVCK